MHVLVRDNNVDEVLRVLKKKMQREGVFREMKRRRFAGKGRDGAPRPQTVRKQAVREGLIAAPKKKLVQIRKAAVTAQVA